MITSNIKDIISYIVLFSTFILGLILIFSHRVIEGNIIAIIGIISVVIIDKFIHLLEFFNQPRSKRKNSVLIIFFVLSLWSIFIIFLFEDLAVYLYFNKYLEYFIIILTPYFYIILFFYFIQYKAKKYLGEQEQIDEKYMVYFDHKIWSFLLQLFLYYSYTYLIVAFSYFAVEYLLQANLKELFINAFVGGFVGALISFLFLTIKDFTNKWNEMTPNRYFNIVFLSNTFAYIFLIISSFL